MVNEFIEVQTYAEVQQIDSRKEMANVLNNQVSTQTDAMNTINDQLESISSTIDDIQIGDLDLTEVTDKLDEIDTTMITTQNQDIIETLNEQQSQINSIENKINTILDKLNEM